MNGYQLPLYEPCGVCSGLVAYDRPDAHRACITAIDRWIRDDNLDFLMKLQKGQVQLPECQTVPPNSLRLCN